MSYREKLIYVLYFCTGMILNCISVGLPLYFATSGYTKVEVGILTSVIFLGSICQPLIGYICDITGRKQLVTKSLYLGLVVISIAMMVFSNFYVMIGLSFLISVCKDPLIGLLDDISIGYINLNGGNYGKLRSGGSWGYALGLFFIMPFEFILKNNSFLVPVFTLIIILSLLFIVVQSILGDISVKQDILKDKTMIKEHSVLYKKEIKEKLLSKTYILFILINVLLTGTSAAKTSYQSIMLQGFGATTLILSLANFISVAPEFIFMPRANKILEGISPKKVLYFVCFGLVLMNVLLAVAENSSFVVAISWLHGFSFAFFIPTFYVSLRHYLGSNISASGILVNSMSQNISSFLMGYFIITPIYSGFGFKTLFLTAALLNILALIPISMLKESNFKENI